MRQLTAIYDQPNFAYYGDAPDYLIVAGQSRDSDTLEQSNFAAFVKAIKEVDRPDTEDDLSDYRVENCGHWAVGWVETLTVRPGSPAHSTALELLDKLDEYPVLDEDDWSTREHEATMDSLEDAISFYLRGFACIDKDAVETIAYHYSYNHWCGIGEGDGDWPTFEDSRERELLAESIVSWRRETRKAV